MKEKYGSDYSEGDESEDSEEAESEDEDGEELTPAVDAAILRTLARIKRRDPAIYEQGKDVFEGVFIFCPIAEANYNVMGRGGAKDERSKAPGAFREGEGTENVNHCTRVH